MLANMEITEESKHYMYDFESFVLEFGGSLGLFLGFSFFTLWDFGSPILVVIKKAIKKTVLGENCPIQHNQTNIPTICKGPR